MTKSETISIDWKPSKTSPIPLYRQIVNHFCARIYSGDWIGGQRLPSQRSMSEIFDVNRSTVALAMDHLSSMELVVTGYGSGTVIKVDTWSLMLSNATPDWENYISGGMLLENKPLVQIINRVEYEPGIIRLGTGEMSPDLFPADTMSKILGNLGSRISSLSYLEPLGLYELRRALALYLRTKGIDTKPSNILIVSGALQALQLISICIAPDKAQIFYEIPSYIASLNIFQSVGGRMHGIPMDASGIMPWAMEKKRPESGHSLLYTIPSFQNPTGKVMSQQRRVELMTACRKSNTPIIEDDVLSDLWLDSPPPDPIMSHDKEGIVLYIGSTSKMLAPGLRMGWMVGPEAVIKRLSDAKMQTDYGSSTLSQWAVTEWLEGGYYTEHLDALRAKLRKRRAFVLGILGKRFKQFAHWDIPTGSYFVWLTLDKNISAQKVFALCLKQRILINIGGLYGDGFENNIRLCYAYESYENLEKGLYAMADIVEQVILGTHQNE